MVCFLHGSRITFYHTLFLSLARSDMPLTNRRHGIPFTSGVRFVGLKSLLQIYRKFVSFEILEWNVGFLFLKINSLATCKSLAPLEQNRLPISCLTP